MDEEELEQKESLEAEQELKNFLTKPGDTASQPKNEQTNLDCFSSNSTRQNFERVRSDNFDISDGSKSQFGLIDGLERSVEP